LGSNHANTLNLTKFSPTILKWASNSTRFFHQNLPFFTIQTSNPSPFAAYFQTPRRGCKREVRNFSQSGTLKNPEVMSAWSSHTRARKITKKHHEGETHGKMSAYIFIYSYIILPIKFKHGPCNIMDSNG